MCGEGGGRSVICEVNGKKIFLLLLRVGESGVKDGVKLS